MNKEVKTIQNEKTDFSPEAVLEQIHFEGFKDNLQGKTFDFVDLFCGAGGMSYGFHKIGELTGKFRWAGAIDIDPHSIDTYEKNFGHRPANLNLGTEDIQTIAHALDLKKGNELILIGCAPCQGFSSHRKKDYRKGVDKRNSSATGSGAGMLPTGLVCLSRG